MTKHLVLNDISLPFETIVECEKFVPHFFAMVHFAHLNKLNFFRVDEVSGDWGQVNFSEGFSLGKLLNEVSNDNEKLIIKSVLANVKCPNLVAMHAELDEILRSTLFIHSEDESLEVRALGAAFEVEGCCISFPTHRFWCENLIPVRKHWDEAGGTTSIDITVPNVCKMDHLESIVSDLHVLRQQNKLYLRSLSVENNHDFPNLLICESALKNFSSSTVTAEDFDKIVEALNALNSAIVLSSNLDELIHNSSLTISGESKETMQQRKLVRHRQFRHPHLGHVIFEIHVKNFPDAKRMHILPDFDARKICIGYFGPHLPTFRYP